MGGVIAMGEITKKENDWQDKATMAAIAGARKIALGNGPLMNTPVGRLSDPQWGWIITAGIFGWIQTRVEQAIDEGLDQEQAVRQTGLSPSPCDVAVVASILPTLADKAVIDWTQPLQAWPKDTMTNFLFLAWQLIIKAESTRDHGPGKILKPSAGGGLEIPEYLRRTPESQKTWDDKKGDEIPFELQPGSS
jgi:hypothetical protein